jgi:PPOX class probable F420-dependent enzyme
MPGLIPDSHADLLSDGKKCVAFLATLMKDKTPQVTPVWFTWDGTYLWINSAKGRVKDINMRIHPEVAVAILDPNDPSRYMQIRGIVVLISEEGANQHVEKLAMKYTGKGWTPNVPGEIRVTYKITPGHVMVSG